MSKKIRLSVPLSENIYKQIEADAERVGVSMSTYVAMILGNHYKQIDMNMNMISDVIKNQLRPLYAQHGLNIDSVLSEEVIKDCADKSKDETMDIINNYKK